MGNANCSVINDTDESTRIYAFNYADGLRTIPRDEMVLAPGNHSNELTSAKVWFHYFLSIISKCLSRGRTIPVLDAIYSGHVEAP